MSATVAAVEFDERTFAITEVEVSPGFLKTKTHIPLDQLVRFGPDVLVVADVGVVANTLRRRCPDEGCEQNGVQGGLR